jgi:hypothetical protein
VVAVNFDGNITPKPSNITGTNNHPRAFKSELLYAESLLCKRHKINASPIVVAKQPKEGWALGGVGKPEHSESPCASVALLSSTKETERTEWRDQKRTGKAERLYTRSYSIVPFLIIPSSHTDDRSATLHKTLSNLGQDLLPLGKNSLVRRDGRVNLFPEIQFRPVAIGRVHSGERGTSQSSARRTSCCL